MLEAWANESVGPLAVGSETTSGYELLQESVGVFR